MTTMTTSKQELDQKKEALTCGFVRETYKPQNNNDLYPDCLLKTITTWTGDIFIRFNAIHKDFKHLIENDGTLIKRGRLVYKMTQEQCQQHHEGIYELKDSQDRNIIIGSNCFFMDKGIHEWKFKVSGSTWNNDRFGVTDDIDICTKYAEMRWNDIDICKKIETHLFVMKDSKYIHENGDIIKVELDLNKNILMCYKHDAWFGVMKIEPNKAYFPVIVSRNDFTNYELL